MGAKSHTLFYYFKGVEFFMVLVAETTKKEMVEEEIYDKLKYFINSSKYCVRINKYTQEISVNRANKFTALLGYIKVFVSSVEELLVNGAKAITVSLNSIKKEMEHKFCIPTERQFEIAISTIKAELDKKYHVVETHNQMIFSRF